MNRPYVVIFIGTALTLLGVFALAAIRPDWLNAGGVIRVEDFGAYWTGTVVNVRGENAYDPANLAALQAAIEPTRITPLPAWSPPWTFAALTPLIPLEFVTARWVWLFVQVATVLGSLTALWRTYGGAADHLISAWGAGLIFYPTLQMLGLGQHSSLVLLGLAGGVSCLAAGHRFAAGAFFGLVLVKPQNVYLIGGILALWIVDRRAWRFAAGGLLIALVLTLGAAIPNPAVFDQYREALTHRPPSHMIPPTAGSLLRFVFGAERFWLVFVPPALAAIWGAWYYARHRAAWNWPERLPLLLFVSYLTSPYGWVYNQVAFLIPLTQILASESVRRPGLVRGVIVGIALLTLVCVAMNAAKFQEYAFGWFAPLCFGLYLAGRAAMRAKRVGIIPSQTEPQ